MNPYDSMEVARALAEPGDAPPTQARLRRAISTAYYAMFHCLATSAANLFIGVARSLARHRTYATFEDLRIEGTMRVRSEIVEKVWAGVEDSPGYPYIHFIAKSDLEENSCHGVVQ